MQLRWQRSTPQTRFLAHRWGSPRGCQTSRNFSQMCFNVSVLPIDLQKSIMSMPLVAIYVQSEGGPKLLTAPSNLEAISYMCIPPRAVLGRFVRQCLSMRRVHSLSPTPLGGYNEN